eukprot:2225108-Pyramimonas_sp.AAC.1
MLPALSAVAEEQLPIVQRAIHHSLSPSLWLLPSFCEFLAAAGAALPRPVGSHLVASNARSQRSVSRAARLAIESLAEAIAEAPDPSKFKVQRHLKIKISESLHPPCLSEVFVSRLAQWMPISLPEARGLPWDALRSELSRSSVSFSMA